MSQAGTIIIKTIFSLVGFLCIIFAFFIGVKRKTTLIAGYDPAKVKDEQGLSRFIGVLTFFIGLFTILFPWVYGFEKTKPLLWVLYYCVPIIILVLIMVIGSTKFEDKSTK